MLPLQLNISGEKGISMVTWFGTFCTLTALCSAAIPHGLFMLVVIIHLTSLSLFLNPEMFFYNI